VAHVSHEHQFGPGTVVVRPGGGDATPPAGLFTRVTPPPGSAKFRSQGYGPSGKLRDKMVLAPNMNQGVLEQYRKLAASLHHAQEQHGTKVVMMASTLAGEGKTLTSTNLALTLSESYRRRVALIDADLRRPTVHEMFDLPNVSGLNDVLLETAGACPIFEVSSHLSVLTAGRPNPDPIGGLTSDRMRQVVAAAASEFDWVIIDTPPVGLLTDAKLLASMVDAVILVIAAGRTPYRMVQRAADALGRERIFGVVLNKVATQDLWRDYGSYSGSYYGYGATNNE
jgi:capsular exopolysaccharide synthesis family protein